MIPKIQMTRHFNHQVGCTRLADSAFDTFLSIKRNGWLKTQSSMAKSTFNTHVSMLCEIGLSRAFLQNLTGLQTDEEINELARIFCDSRVLEIDFDDHFPEWQNSEDFKQDSFAELKKILNW